MIWNTQAHHVTCTDISWQMNTRSLKRSDNDTLNILQVYKIILRSFKCLTAKLLLQLASKISSPPPPPPRPIHFQTSPMSQRALSSSRLSIQSCLHKDREWERERDFFFVVGIILSVEGIKLSPPARLLLSSRILPSRKFETLRLICKTQGRKGQDSDCRSYYEGVCSFNKGLTWPATHPTPHPPDLAIRLQVRWLLKMQAIETKCSEDIFRSSILRQGSVLKVHHPRSVASRPRHSKTMNGSLT